MQLWLFYAALGGVQGKFLYLGMLGHRFVSGCWMKNFLGFVPLSLVMPTSTLCPIQCQPEVLLFLFKSGEVKSAGHSAVPMRVSLKCGDPSL